MNLFHPFYLPCIYANTCTIFSRFRNKYCYKEKNKKRTNAIIFNNYFIYALIFAIRINFGRLSLFVQKRKRKKINKTDRL
ncbi:hypothetical protein V1478_010059 [Vespula squamosa]|uniref:Uncharacterized protein n=1 Tax=Vespula squamosa TaxID=30214 RepID=A0ABD2AIN3_VESSQ